MRVLLGKKLGRLILTRNTRRFFLGLRLFFRKFVFDSHAFFFLSLSVFASHVCILCCVLMVFCISLNSYGNSSLSTGKLIDSM